PSSAMAAASPRSWWRPMRPPASGGSRPTSCCGPRHPPSAARAAARTTSPRAAAATSRGSAMRSTPSAPPSAAGAPSAMRPGVRLGVDPGDVRIGVAACDPSGIIATPLTTVQRGPGDLQQLRTLALEHEPIEVVVGLPRSLSGAEGPAAVRVRAFATELAEVLAPVPVRLSDERLSTVTAESLLR